MKRTLCILCALVLCLTLLPTAAFAANNGKAIQLGTDALNAKVNTTNAATIYLGKNHEDNPGAWRVIGYDGSGVASAQGNMTLLAAGNMGLSQFDTDGTSNEYAPSNLKTAIDALAGKLTTVENAAVNKRTLISGEYSYVITDCITGAQVDDAVFWPLSIAEAYDVEDELRIVDKDNPDWMSSYWWLRSPGDGANYAAAVLGNGTVAYVINNVINEYGVRPAFHLDRNSVLLTSAAAGGKAGDGGLKTMDDYTGSEWKLTLLDSSRDFAVTETEVSVTSGGTVTLHYTGATTGTNEYISVIIADNNGTQYYGRVTQTAAADGTVEVTLPAGLALGTYTLYAFSEQCNGDYMTDYASAFAEIALTVVPDKTIMLGASVLNAEINTAYAATVYFSKNNTDQPGAWRVIGYNGNGVTSAQGDMTLLAAGNMGLVQFDVDRESNEYAISDLKAAIDALAGKLTAEETAAVNERTLTSGSYEGDNTDCIAGAQVDDAVFWPLSTAEANEVEKELRILNKEHPDWASSYWWLRSPGYRASYAAFVQGNGDVGSEGKSVASSYGGYGARPAFHLDLNSVLLTSAAAGGKEGDGGLKAVTDYTDDEWKLTLLDDSRGFAISDAKTNASGDAIAFSYSGAQTGEKEYISVVIEEGGEITHYGRILQLDGTTNGASGTESLALPAGTTLSGTTKLYVFNEQYNGGENDDTRLTDYGSRLIEVVNPTVDTTAPALSGGSATRDSETTATVTFTSDEAGTCYYIAQETEITLTNTGIAAQGTEQACEVGENEIKLDNLTASAWYVAVVVKDAVGNVSEILSITIPAPTYSISASPATLDFGSKTVGYAEAPDAQTVTVTNTGNQTVTVDLPSSTNYTITAGEGFANDAATLAPNSTASFTVRPVTGLDVGSHSETLTISGSNGAGAEVSLAFAVEPISIENAQVNVAGEYTYDGDEIVPDGSAVTVTLAGETLEAGIDYALAYSDNINAGTATVTVTGTGNYTGTATGTFTINKAEWTGVKTVEGTITPDTDGSVNLPAVPDGAAFGTPAGDPEVENIAITGNVLGYTGGSGIENGKTYTVTVPVGETANYLAYDITVSLAGDTGSGLAQTAAAMLRVFGTEGMLHITGTVAEAAVYDVRGALVYRGTARTLHLPAGVYIVRAEEQVRKAVVK